MKYSYKIEKKGGFFLMSSDKRSSKQREAKNHSLLKSPASLCIGIPFSQFTDVSSALQIQEKEEKKTEGKKWAKEET